MHKISSLELKSVLKVSVCLKLCGENQNADRLSDQNLYSGHVNTCAHLHANFSAHFSVFISVTDEQKLEKQENKTRVLPAAGLILFYS